MMVQISWEQADELCFHSVTHTKWKMSCRKELEVCTEIEQEHIFIM